MLRIKELREEKGLSQLQFAQKVNLTQQAISLYEKGDREPSLEVIKNIADFFEVTTDYLLGKSDIRNPEKIKSIPHANSSGLDTTGLDEEDLKELQKQVDYIKKLKRMK